jgi:hypothetical protein
MTIDLEPQLRREQAAIQAIHARISRNPLRSLLWNKPWRAAWRPRWTNPREVWQWLRSAHDCADPSVACSCTGGFRFPSSTPPPDRRTT